jgi:hypothetical protein
MWFMILDMGRIGFELPPLSQKIPIRGPRGVPSSPGLLIFGVSHIIESSIKSTMEKIR